MHAADRKSISFCEDSLAGNFENFCVEYGDTGQLKSSRIHSNVIEVLAAVGSRF